MIILDWKRHKCHKLPAKRILLLNRPSINNYFLHIFQPRTVLFQSPSYILLDFHWVSIRKFHVVSSEMFHVVYCQNRDRKETKTFKITGFLKVEWRLSLKAHCMKKEIWQKLIRNNQNRKTFFKFLSHFVSCLSGKVVAQSY